MSAGRVHTKASVILAGAFAAATWFSNEPANIQYAIGALAGVLVSPDCDVDNGFISYQYIRRTLGYWAEKTWDWIWYFYRRSIKHGSELSHFPVISTLGRLAYLFLFVIVIPTLLLSIFFVDLSVPYELAWWYGKACQYWRVVIGLMGADLIHWALDLLTTEHVGKTRRHGLWGWWERTTGIRMPVNALRKP